MQIVYAQEALPERWTASVFLAGPTPRSREVASWRPRALEILAERGFDGVVFVPEARGGAFKGDYLDQVTWEERGLNAADVVLFWVPRELERMPAFTTNVEFGLWARSGKAVLGAPPQAPKTRYLRWLAGEARVPTRGALEATIDAALERVGPGAMRCGGERFVPLSLWRTASFQAWYAAQQAAGNRLDDARLLWSYTPRRAGIPFAWILKVKVWIGAEQRHKSNEWVLARADLSAVLMHGPAAPDPLDTRVVIAREFRASVRSRDGLVRELPGGSSLHAESPLAVAIEEVSEEVGLDLAPERLVPMGDRQLAATWSSHRGALFRAALTAEEMSQIERDAREGTARGVGSERVTLEIRTLRSLMADPGADWTTIGMVAQGLLG